MDLAQRCLEGMVEKGAVSHALLFCGPHGAGKQKSAFAFAARMIGQKPTETLLTRIRNGAHPDVHLYTPEGKSGTHPIESMRQFGEEVLMPPMQSPRKVFIILDAERMLPSSANALLKTFEEPPLDSVILLISAAPHLLMPTLLSRCTVVRFSPGKPETPPEAPAAILQQLLANKSSYDFLSKGVAALAEAIEKVHASDDPSVADINRTVQALFQQIWRWHASRQPTDVPLLDQLAAAIQRASTSWQLFTPLREVFETLLLECEGFKR